MALEYLRRFYGRYFLLLAVTSFVMFYTYISIRNNNLRDLEKEKLIKSSQIHLIDADDSNVGWFVQVTDTHISIFKDLKRSVDLVDFCAYLSQSIFPMTFLITGDLTDSKNADHIGSRQISDEWKTYKQIVDQCHVMSNEMYEKHSTSKWSVHDIRGNHDTFDLLKTSPDVDFYASMSAHGIFKRPPSYRVTLPFQNHAKNITFVGIDATSSPGLKRPFNFLGHLDTPEYLSTVKNLIGEAWNDLDNNKTDHLIFFGHYPNSVISVKDPKYSSLVEMLAADNTLTTEQNVVYLCGHFHSLGGLATKMYARHPISNVLELELADWKDDRMFRIMAFDQGSLAFKDFQFEPTSNSHIQVMLTHPQHPLLLKKPSSHTSVVVRQIRALVFSNTEIVQVYAIVHSGRDDNVDTKVYLKQSEVRNLSLPMSSPLYTSSENVDDIFYDLFRESISKSPNYLTISVELSDGTTHKNTFPFSLKYNAELLTSHDSENILSAYILLLTNFHTTLRLIYVLLTSILIASLCLIKLVAHMKEMQHQFPVNKDKSEDDPVTKSLLRSPPNAMFARSLASTMKSRIMDRFITLGERTDLLYPFLAFILYEGFGPWCFAELLTGRYGLIFLWFIVIPSDSGDSFTVVDPDVTFLYSILCHVLIYYPLLFLLVSIDSKKQSISSRNSSCLVKIVQCISFLVLFSLSLIPSTDFYKAYGCITLISHTSLGRLALILYMMKFGLYNNSSIYCYGSSLTQEPFRGHDSSKMRA